MWDYFQLVYNVLKKIIFIAFFGDDITDKKVDFDYKDDNVQAFFLHKILYSIWYASVLYIRVLGPWFLYLNVDTIINGLNAGSFGAIVYAFFWVNVYLFGWRVDIGFIENPWNRKEMKQKEFIKKMLADGLFVVNFLNRFYDLYFSYILFALLLFFITFFIAFIYVFIKSDRKSRFKLVDSFLKSKFYFKENRTRKSIFLALLDFVFFGKINVELSYTFYIFFLFLLCLNIYIFFYFTHSTFFF